MNTTITISVETKEKLRNLGKVGETYDDVIKRMYAITKKNMVLAYLYDESDSIDIDDAIVEAKKW